ncbi:MAG: hypothetical protein ABSE49_27880 [Polyangiaceae bacterium]
MNRRLVAIATVVVVAGVAVVVFGSGQRRGNPLPAATSPHSEDIDHAMSAVLELYRAPQGTTPCETAYNAFRASLDFSTQHPVTPVVLRLASHEDFIARCSGLPVLTQECLAPRYISEHRAECRNAKPPDDVLASMVEMKRVAAPGSAATGPALVEPPPVGSP